MSNAEWNELEVLIDDDTVKLLLWVFRDLESDGKLGLEGVMEAHGESKEKLVERFLSEAGQHEAMDRAFITHEHVDSYLLHHPYVLLTPKAYKLASLASMALAELYQECGKAEFTQGTPKCSNCSPPSPSGRGPLSWLRSCYSSFWSRLIKEWEPEYPS